MVAYNNSFNFKFRSNSMPKRSENIPISQVKSFSCNFISTANIKSDLPNKNTTTIVKKKNA